MAENINIKAPRWQILLAYFFLYTIWGSYYLAIRYSVETIPPALSGSIRFFIAGLILLSFRIYKTGNAPSLHSWKTAFITSVLPFSATYALVTKAVLYIPSSLAALLAAMEPLWYCLFGWLFFKRSKPAVRDFIGIGLGFFGIAVLIVFDPNVDFTSGTNYILGILLAVSSSMAWVMGAFFTAQTEINEESPTFSGMQMICGGIQMLIMQLAITVSGGESLEFGSFSLRSILALAYLIIFSSLIAYTSFVWLMRTEPAYRVSTYAFVNPIVAVFVGWLIGGEVIRTNVWIALFFVTFSVILLVMKKEREL